MFKSKQQKLEEQEELKKILQQEEDERERQREEQARKKAEKEKQELLEYLKNGIENNSIVCLCEERGILKQIALNYMLEKGWVCVQNDACMNKYGVVYVLTFAEKSFTKGFINVNKIGETS